MFKEVPQSIWPMIVVELLACLIERHLLRIFHEEVGDYRRQWQIHSHTVSLFLKLSTEAEHFADRSSTYWLLAFNVADREPIIWLLGHAMLQSTVHFSGAMLLRTIAPECFA
jgi:hypothetical protein